MITHRNMIDEFEKVMNYQNPNDIISSDLGHQEIKSAKMRRQILLAAIKCLSNKGYTNTTTQVVAKTAGVSRGALLHHYITREKLMVATIDYITSERVRSYVKTVNNLSDQERIEDGAAMEAVWQMSKSDEYQALLELAGAARTDERIKAIFLPKVKLHYKVIFQSLPEVFPEWKTADLDDLQLAHDTITVVIAGLQIYTNILGTKKRRVNVRQFIFNSLQTLRQE